MAGDKLLTYCSISYPVYTRLNMPPIHTPEIPLPDGLKPESLSRYPGVIADVHMLLSANNGDGTFSPIPRKPKQPAMQRRLYRFPCQWWRYAILLMGYYCRKLERAFRHLPQRRTLRCHVLLQGRADKETLRAVCRLS